MMDTSRANGLVTFTQSLDRETEARLIREAQAGSERAKEHLIRAYTPVITKMAIGFAKPFDDRDAAAQDMFSAGAMGFLKAIERYDFNYTNENGERLALFTYAQTWVTELMNDARRNMSKAVRIPMTDRNRKIIKCLKRAAADHDCPVNRMPEIAILQAVDAANLIVSSPKATRDEVWKVLMGIIDVRSMDYNNSAAGTRGGEIEDGSFNKIVSHLSHIESDDIEDKLIGEMDLEKFMIELKSVIETVLVSTRDRDIFKKRVLTEDPPTLDELGTKYGITRERVRQIEVRATEKISAEIILRYAKQPVPKKEKVKGKPGRPRTRFVKKTRHGISILEQMAFA